MNLPPNMKERIARNDNFGNFTLFVFFPQLPSISLLSSSFATSPFSLSCTKLSKEIGKFIKRTLGPEMGALHWIGGVFLPSFQMVSTKCCLVPSYLSGDWLSSQKASILVSPGNKPPFLLLGVWSGHLSLGGRDTLCHLLSL